MWHLQPSKLGSCLLWHVCIYVCAHARVCACVRACVSVCVCVCVSVSVCACTHTHTHTRARARACTGARTRTHTHTVTHTHTDTHTHTHRNTYTQSRPTDRQCQSRLCRPLVHIIFIWRQVTNLRYQIGSKTSVPRLDWSFAACSQRRYAAGRFPCWSSLTRHQTTHDAKVNI